MAAPSSVFTISRVAGMLGETEERLQELASEMEPEDGCLIVWGTGDQSITAFTREGVEYLEQLIKGHKAQKSTSAPRSRRSLNIRRTILSGAKSAMVKP